MPKAKGILEVNGRKCINILVVERKGKFTPGKGHKGQSTLFSDILALFSSQKKKKKCSGKVESIFFSLSKGRTTEKSQKGRC